MKKGGLWLSLVLLSAATPVFSKENSPIPAEVARTHGYVYVAFPKGGGDSLSIRSVTNGRAPDVRMPVEAVSMPGAQAFAQWLPEGRYQILALGNMKWKNGPVFEVQAGRVTDLGSLIPVNVGGYQQVLLPVHHAENDGGVEAATKAFASVLKDPAPIRGAIATVSAPMTIDQPSTGMGLVADLVQAHRLTVNKTSTLEQLTAASNPAEFLRIERSMVTPLQDEPARGADGTLYFPADLGQLRVRRSDGHWSNVGMDTLRQILAVEYADGRLIAGSDDGHIRASQDDGATWSELKTLGRLESIIDIDHANGTWVVTTSEKFDESHSGFFLKSPPSIRLRVYVGHREDLGDLALSKEFIAPKGVAGWGGPRGQLVDGYYYIAVAPSVQRLDLTSGQWTAIAPPASVRSLWVDPDTGVLTAELFKVFVSSDHGDHWTQISRPPVVVHDVQMESLDRGWASRWNIKAFSGTWETYAYSPAINDWEKTGETPFNCKPMRVAKDLPVLCIASDGSIFGEHDGTWEVEFSAQ